MTALRTCSFGFSWKFRPDDLAANWDKNSSEVAAARSIRRVGDSAAAKAGDPGRSCWH
jgi:hypothetical protein